MGWQVQGVEIANEFIAPEFIVNQQGAFYYNGTPGPNTLAFSDVPGTNPATTVLDPFGNYALTGRTVYYEIGPGDWQANVQFGIGTSVFAGTAENNNSWGIVASALELLTNTVNLDSAGSMGFTTFSASDPFQFFNGQVICANTIIGQNGIQVDNITPPPGTSGVATIYATSGQLAYTDPNGTHYDTGRLTGLATGQTVNSTSFTALSGMALTLGPGIYKISALLRFTVAASAGQWETQLEFTGAATTSYQQWWTPNVSLAAGVATMSANQTAFGTTQSGPNPSVAGLYRQQYEGYMNVPAGGAGVLSLSGATTVAADTWTLFAGSWIEAVPVA